MGNSAMGTILVADDDRQCRESIQRVLEREGYTVETVWDVDSALEAIRARHFNMLVCDYRMPGKTGIDLLKQMRLEHFSIPVLMISAFADVATEAHARELGAVEMIRKPIRRRDLVESAARVVGG